MPLFMDVHNLLRAANAEAVAVAKARDLEVQDKYGVKYLRYWLDSSTGHMFCLVEAPTERRVPGPSRGARRHCQRDIRGHEGCPFLTI